MTNALILHVKSPRRSAYSDYLRKLLFSGFNAHKLSLKDNPRIHVSYYKCGFVQFSTLSNMRLTRLPIFYPMVSGEVWEFRAQNDVPWLPVKLERVEFITEYKIRMDHTAGAVILYFNADTLRLVIPINESPYELSFADISYLSSVSKSL